jgi:hypothetical protein
MMAEEDSPWVVAPCLGCGVDVEDEGPVDQNWYCSPCWKKVQVTRLEQALKAAEAEVRRLQDLYDAETGALSFALRQSVEREKRLEAALKEQHALEVDGLVERARYVARLEAALQIIAQVDMTDDYYQRMKSDGLIEEPPRWGSPKTIAVAALDVPRKPTLA